MTVSRRSRFLFEADAITNLTWVSGVLGILVLLGGCRLCADCDDEAYASYGGAWQRTHRDSGRVGSIFDPGGSRTSDLSERAKSDGPNVTNHDALRSDDAAADAGGDSAEPNQEEDRDIMDTDGEEPRNEEREEELRNLEKRYRNLQLEEINHKQPRPNGTEWQ